MFETRKGDERKRRGVRDKGGNRGRVRDEGKGGRVGGKGRRTPQT